MNIEFLGTSRDRMKIWLPRNILFLTFSFENLKWLNVPASFSVYRIFFSESKTRYYQTEILFCHTLIPLCYRNKNRGAFHLTSFIGKCPFFYNSFQILPDCMKVDVKKFKNFQLDWMRGTRSTWPLFLLCEITWSLTFLTNHLILACNNGKHIETQF